VIGPSFLEANTLEREREMISKLNQQKIYMQLFLELVNLKVSFQYDGKIMMEKKE
jgi:hypothetical protein